MEPDQRDITEYNNLAKLDRARRDARDIEIINSNTDRLNAEAADVLEYQAWP